VIASGLRARNRTINRIERVATGVACGCVLGRERTLSSGVFNFFLSNVMELCYAWVTETEQVIDAVSSIQQA
jgi:hypothetical protein